MLPIAEPASTGATALPRVEVDLYFNGWSGSISSNLSGLIIKRFRENPTTLPCFDFPCRLMASTREIQVRDYLRHHQLEER